MDNLKLKNYNKKYSRSKYRFFLQKKKLFKWRSKKKRIRLIEKKLYFLTKKKLKNLDYRTNLNLYSKYLINHFNNTIFLKKKGVSLNSKINLNKIKWYYYLKNKKYSKTKIFDINSSFKNSFLAIKHNNKSNAWKRLRFWIIKRKASKFKKKQRKRLMYNSNVETHKYRISFTIISKEFFNTPKFKRSKPLAFSSKIHKFIRYFF